ncbi:ATP-binding protein [Mycobacterium tuberculosis]|uniref:ATP-binding protein n=1 Tax=Mycobacterium tuberculosis TaxID=1773 RepID=UPI002729AAB6|nr:ATP-binding protein [Mycobacterium tuberculosis]
MEIRTEHDGDDLTGWFDASRLAQVVRNLLSNAVKFSPAGSVVTVSLAGTPAAIAVADTDGEQAFRGPRPDPYRKHLGGLCASDMTN